MLLMLAQLMVHFLALGNSLVLTFELSILEYLSPDNADPASHIVPSTAIKA